MADLSKIKRGDKLRLELTVTDLDLSDRNRPVEAEERHWLDASEVEAAEHIPAPRIWKPRDAVRLRSGAFNDGIVVDIRSADKESLVYWPSGRLDWEKNGDLEPDEAPE